MGMSASQWNLCALTGRVHDINLELEKLSLEKMSLTRDMQAISLNYQKALSSKVLKWSNNDGISYSDITYNTLMSPCAANNNSPVLLSDYSGKIMLDKKYAQYAELISPNGAAGGDYESNRLDILSSLTGIPKETLETLNSASDNTDALYQAMLDAESNMQKYAPQALESEDIIKMLFSAENSSASLDSSNVSAFVSTLKSKISPYLSPELNEKFSNACDEAAKNNSSYSTQQEFLTSVVDVLTDAATASVFIAKEQGSYVGTYSNYVQAKELYEAAKTEYEAGVGSEAMILDGEADNKIAFYDELFTAVAELGWKKDESLNDSEYLSQMLQNNSYYIVTMTKNTGYDPSLPTDSINYEYSFDTEAATNYSNIFQVNDSDANAVALAEYETEKCKISNKESRVDQRMTNLETEKSAIEKEIESVEKVKDDNIDRTFGIFA